MSITPRSERGQVVVFFALLIPVLFGLAAVVMDIGNWYVHKRHLQTQVDATVLAPAPEFTGCFDPNAWSATDAAIEQNAIGFAGDTQRLGTVGNDPSTSTNRQLQEPDDVRVVLNSSQYWAPVNGLVPGTNGYGLDKTMDSNGDGDGGFCNERYIDAKATDEDAPLLWGLIPFSPDPKSHAKAAVKELIAAKGILPFAVPEPVPGAVAAIFVDEDAAAANNVLAASELSPDTSDPVLSSKYSVFSGIAGRFSITGRDDVSVVILVSRYDVPDPRLNFNSLGQICSQAGVKCYSGSGQQSGLALIHGYESGGGSAPILRQTTVSGCDSSPNLSGPYFSLTGRCSAVVNAEIATGALVNFRARLHRGSNCGGGGISMSGSGGTFTASDTLPRPSQGGQVPFSIDWQAQGSGGWTCFGRYAARPFVANRQLSGPIQYLWLDGADTNGVPFANSYSIPKEPSMQPVTYTVTVGLLPPLRQSTLSDQPVLIRAASEDNPSNTQSIDCDVDNYPYPPPYNNVPADVAEIAYGCVTPYKENPTLDCSAYSFGGLPPAPPPTTTFENAPECAETKQGQVAVLREGLNLRIGEPPNCAPNNWPDPPITQQSITDLVTNFSDDPRLVTLVVTDFGVFGTGTAIVPIRYFAGFYITGKDVSQQSPACLDDDPHPLGYDDQDDDGDIWGYFVTQVVYGSSGAPGPEDCDFSTQPQNCVLTLVE